MVWLDRSHPNSLYPFLAVMPSGCIFVLYWNEARVLGPVTSATIKTLPNALGAINDDKGRLHLSPLRSCRAPPAGIPLYRPTPPGVLVCGGSIILVDNAIENCMPSRYGSASRTVGGVATFIPYGGEGNQADSHVLWLVRGCVLVMTVAIVLAVWGGLSLEMLYPC